MTSKKTVNVSYSRMAGREESPSDEFPHSAQPPDIVYSGGGAKSVVPGHKFIKEFLALFFPHSTMDTRFGFEKIPSTPLFVFRIY